MDWVAEIIDSRGGTTAVAAALDLPETTVSSWKSRGTIKPRYWPSLILLPTPRGKEKLTLERLAKLASATDTDRSTRGRRSKAA
jgi:hypothetical protein